jgi:hypothetical protein
MGAAEKLEFRNQVGGIDFDRIVQLMNVEKSELAAMIGYDRTSLKSNKPASPKMLATLSPYFRILAMLWDHFEGDPVKVSAWLHDPKSEWLYLSPIEMLRRKKADKVVDYLIAHLDLRADLFNG